ncbi:MAG: hypothetical protein ACYCVL_05085 [Gemmatimonadaceae bacterium]
MPPIATRILVRQATFEHARHGGVIIDHQYALHRDPPSGDLARSEPEYPLNVR